MRSLLFVIACLVVLPLHAADRPNVILVFIDDMGWGDFSCFGNTEAKTPNIDRLAAEGIAFEQFYVNSPICSPSRVAISTGQYPQRWDITSYLNNRKDSCASRHRQLARPQSPHIGKHPERLRLCHRSFREMAHGRATRHP